MAGVERKQNIGVSRWPADCNHAAMSLTISSRKSNELEILVLSGRLTLGDGTRALRETARKALDRGADILVDLSGVDYIDSAGLGELVSAYASAAARGRHVKLLRPIKRVDSPGGRRKLLHITKMYSAFEIFEDEAKAIATFQTSYMETDK